MKISYGNDGTAQQDIVPALPPPPPPYQPLPPPLPPRRNRIVSAGANMMVGALLLSCGVFGAETLAPPDYKPSAILGGYQGRMAAEVRARELETQAKYDGWIQQAQISIAQQQVGYQGQVQAVVANYQAVYDRARLFSEATARIQQDYSRQVLSQKRQQQDSSSGLVNLAQLGADLFRPFDPTISENLQTYADETSSRLRERLDDSIQQGITVDVEGWDTGLPSPDAVRADIARIKPIVIPPPPRISRDPREGHE